MKKYLVPLVVFLAPMYIVRFYFLGIPTTIVEIFLYLIFIYYLVTDHKKILSFLKTKAFLFAMMFVAIGFVGAIVDPSLRAGLGLFKGYFLNGVLLFILIGAFGNFELIKNSLIASGTLTAIVALALHNVTIEGRLLDLESLSPNYLAMFLTPIFAMGAFQLQKYISNKKTNYILIFALIVMLLAIYLTGSRGALIGILFALIYSVYGFYRDRLSKKSLKKLSVSLAILSVVAVIATAFVFAPDWSDHSRKATSSNIRFYIWSTTIEMIKKNPVFGVGLSNYQNYFSEMTKDMVNYPEFISPQALTAHNLYLNLFATCGLLGLATFILLVIKSAFWRNDQAVAVALIALLAYGLVDTPFFRNDLAILFWVIIAISYGQNNRRAN